MNAHNQKPQLVNTSEELLLQLFNTRIMAAESLNSGQMVLSKQRFIRELRRKIELFIREHAYSYFTITVLNAEDDLDLDRPLAGIIVRNFELFMKGENYDKPRQYLIAILPTWTEAKFFQLSPSGLRIKETIV